MSKSEEKTVAVGNKLMWFRNDLRMDDNPALNAACSASVQSNTKVYAVFFICDEQWKKHDVAPARTLLVLKRVQYLKQSLAKNNIDLLVVDTKSFDTSVKKVAEVSQQLECDSVYFNYEIPLNERLRDKQVNELLQQKNIACKAYHSQCLMKPGSVLKSDGSMYEVFGAFKKRFLQQFRCDQLNLEFMPQIPASNLESDQKRKVENSYVNQSSAVLEKYIKQYQSATSIADLYCVSDEDIQSRLQIFLKQSLKNYYVDRDIPSLDGTSNMSAYLSMGAVSAKRLAQQAWQFSEQHIDAKEGFGVWLVELIWRDFYRHILCFYPNLAKGDSFKPKYNEMKWERDERFIEVWKAGQTGYPMIDAAMRQLNQTGWMHNRLRMLCAVYFSKYALHDWHIGEQYFMSQLVDGDFASNNGGWQWSSATGVDAAPYFRLMSPIRQAERFDPNARYIKQFVPELANIEAKKIIKMHSDIYQQTTYPKPIFDIAGRKDTIVSFYKSV